MKGTITKIEQNKGFAFLRDEEGTSRFIHCRQVKPPADFDKLREGMTVDFVPVTEPNGKGNGQRANEVTIAG